MSTSPPQVIALPQPPMPQPQPQYIPPPQPQQPIYYPPYPTQPQEYPYAYQPPQPQPQQPQYEPPQSQQRNSTTLDLLALLSTPAGAEIIKTIREAFIKKGGDDKFQELLFNLMIDSLTSMHNLAKQTLANLANIGPRSLGEGLKTYYKEYFKAQAEKDSQELLNQEQQMDPLASLARGLLDLKNDIKEIKNSLKKTSRSVKTNEEYKCPFCGKEFETKQGLGGHIAKVHKQTTTESPTPTTPPSPQPPPSPSEEGVILK